MGFGKASQGRFLILEFLEDAIKLCDLEDFFDFGSQPDNFHITAPPDNRHVAVDQLAHAGAIEVQQSAYVQDDFLAALRHQLIDGVSQRAACERRQLTGEINNRDFVRLTDDGREVQCGSLSLGAVIVLSLFRAEQHKSAGGPASRERIAWRNCLLTDA